MLRMDNFALHHPSSPAEAAQLWADLSNDAPKSVMFINGGTDLLPNMKHRIIEPAHLIDLSGALSSGWHTNADNQLVIGAGTKLSELAQIPHLPPLAESAGLVASPQIRNMATFGGNIMLDTRCMYYNQSEPWREALGWCLKAKGDWCHVTNNAKTCVAAQSSDTVPVLLSMDAALRFVGPEGTSEMPLRSIFRFDGRKHLKIEPHQILTEIVVPLPNPSAGRRIAGSYHKLRTRGSIDFPQLGLAVWAEVEGTGDTTRLHQISMVVGAINPQPKPIKQLDAFLGQLLSDTAIAEMAERVVKQTRPQRTIPDDEKWRRSMAGVFAEQALTALRQ